MVWPTIAALLLAFGFGYLLGSIPFGLIFTRMAGLGDVREIGSGNIGATNVLRTGNKKIAAATLIADALKGTLAVVLGKIFYGLDAALAAGLGAFLGHLFPVWLKFKGGKGVATYLGIVAGLFWPSILMFGIIWGAMAAIAGYSSLSALIASLSVPILLYTHDMFREAALTALLAALIWWKHIPNINRLLSGTEPKIGAKE
jgi:acyl phosphate:glycerol-3-phosphate acyltransferase